MCELVDDQVYDHHKHDYKQSHGLGPLLLYSPAVSQSANNHKSRHVTCLEANPAVLEPGSPRFLSIRRPIIIVILQLVVNFIQFICHFSHRILDEVIKIYLHLFGYYFII